MKKRGAELRIIYGVKEARAQLLSRRGLGMAEVPPAIQQRITEVFGEALSPEGAVRRIIDDVRTKGDAALRHYIQKLDGVALESIEVPQEDVEAAYDQVDDELLGALEVAAARIRSFHEAHLQRSWMDFADGALGQLIIPLQRVGIYAPGGTAPYPSTVLMSAIPAKVAGVDEVYVATPPQAGGIVPPSILVAAHLSGVDRVFKMGGAQAIAAFAYGTQSVPRVDKICGPGGLFVVLAKKLVYGDVAIDGLHGPTETVVIADATANPALCAADLLAQAEHDPLASAIMLTPSAELAQRVAQEIDRQLQTLERRDIAAQSLERNGCIVVVESLDEALELANKYAPEHLCLLMKDAWSWLGRVRNAGGVFVGEGSPEAMGDYVAGPSHVMPTAGTARFASPLHTGDFLKVTSVVALNPEALAALGPAAIAIAQAEGLTAHARAIEMRSDYKKDPEG